MLTVENTEKLAPQLLAMLAEPFLRGSKRTRTDHAGVGLGLAIVKSITQAHDGTLTPHPAERRRAPRHGATTPCATAHPLDAELNDVEHRLGLRGRAGGTPRRGGALPQPHDQNAGKELTMALTLKPARLP